MLHLNRTTAAFARGVVVTSISILLGGCLIVPTMVAAVGGMDVGVGALVDERVGPASQYIEPTLEPSPVKGPIRCSDKSTSYGERLHCVGGIPGHAKWCNDLIAIDPGSGSFILTFAGYTPGERLIEKHCLKGEVPPEIAELNSTGRSASSSSARSGEVLLVQHKLRERGFDPGPIDGIMGSKTRAAIMEFQRSEGMSADGRITSDLNSKLGL